MLGFKCVMYVNTATGEASYGTPTWTAVTLARDVEIPDTRPEAEGGMRGEDQDSISTGQRKISFTTELIYKPGNPAYTALAAAFANNTPVDLFFADAPGGAGAVGRRGDFYLTTHTIKQALKEKVMVSLAGGRTNDNDHAYGPYTFPA
jgi:hypothetical protein